MIVCFDTNVLVSAVATRGLCADVFNLALAEHELVIGETVLIEVRQVLLKKLRLPSAAADEMNAFLRAHATVVTNAPRLVIARLDESDSAALSEAIAGHADVLVTGDQEFQMAEPPGAIRILSPRGFWDLLRAA